MFTPHYYHQMFGLKRAKPMLLHVMYLSSKWRGQTRKDLALGHGVYVVG